MFKKIFTIATLLCVIPMLANAATKWQLGTRAMSQGGVIDSRNKTGQTVANGSIFKQYTTANNSTVTVTPNAGFKISKISNNGIVTVAPIAAPFTFAPAGTGNVTIQATFARVSFVLNAIAGSGGTVNKSSYPIVYTGIQSPAKTFIFTPNPGLAVTGIIASAGALNTNFQYLNAVTGAPTALGVVNEKVKVSVVNVPSNITFSASFVGTPTGGTTPPTGCVNCHATQGIGGGRDVGSVYYNWSSSNRATRAPSCATCHVGADTGGHPGVTSDNCIGCHAVPAPGHNGGVADNNFGVRSIVQEFSKWSHHVTGVNLNNAHCAACHLEGKVANGVVVIDKTYHMADNKTHLRNADTDADMQWDPAAPSHSTMDTYCMSCHDANGATSAGNVAVQAYLNTANLAAAGKTASPGNPFGDTISNQYDEMERPAVVDAKGQFATGNYSHHAVNGKRYSGRSRVSKGGTIADAVFTANSSATLPGKRSTIYDAGRFTTIYTTLADAGGETGTRNGGSTLGDDSTLHCGDCHTVGQWAPNVAKNADGTNALAAIGAHGSNNEYMLRNMAGTDARHVGQQMTSAGVAINTGNYLVCFNCHNITNYGIASGSVGHGGEHGTAETCNGPFNTRAEPNGALRKPAPAVFNGPTTSKYSGIGEDRLKSIITQANKADGTAPTAAGAYGAQTTGHLGFLGNIYGIQCANCHNSGVDNGYGGIHGSKSQTYTDGLGNTTKHERFLPGLGNVKFVPGTRGGYDGTGTTAVYAIYSANAAKTSFTQLPVRTYSVARDGFTTAINNGQSASTNAAGARIGSFEYTTGGITNDLNWEQKSSDYDNGSATTVETRSGNYGPSGCYTLSAPTGAKRINKLQANGYPADDVRYAPSDGMKIFAGTPQEEEVLDNWGGCEDHGSTPAGKSGEPFVRGIIRPVSY